MEEGARYTWVGYRQDWRVGEENAPMLGEKLGKLQMGGCEGEGCDMCGSKERRIGEHGNEKPCSK
jgi:hypothetical protein